MLEDKPRILVVEARFYDDLADELLKGAKAALDAGGAEHDVITVPGALEIPAVIAMAEEGGHRAAGVRYDGYVALGCVMRGETYHFEVVSNESARGLMDLAVGRRIPIGNGILTVETENQAWARASVTAPVDDGEYDKGGFAARACLEMVKIRRRLLGLVR
ncbi:MAG TPA: 6,7-dimethyl-8-ribityllumazine synthase [Caulobacteraceae bacterium]|nr:6,7-dimethyl-8-ribityllumazine synthase [Caulobacteraceae bacterium]